MYQMSDSIQNNLSHILCRYQEAGIDIFLFTQDVAVCTIMF